MMKYRTTTIHLHTTRPFWKSQGHIFSTLSRSMWNVIMTLKFIWSEVLKIQIIFAVYRSLITCTILKITHKSYFKELSRRSFWTDSQTVLYLMYKVWCSSGGNVFTPCAFKLKFCLHPKSLDLECNWKVSWAKNYWWNSHVSMTSGSRISICQKLCIIFQE